MIEVGMKNERTRQKWLEKTLSNVTPASRILDAGAGELQFKKYCQHLEYVSQDFAQYDGVGNDQGLQVGAWDQRQLDIVSDITDIPEEYNSFDAIMCIEVFEHLPDPVAAIKEFSRLIKPTGHLIITAPFCSLTHFAPYHYYTGFNKYFYEKHLVENGFEILEIQENGNFFEYLAQEIRRIPQVSAKYSNAHVGYWGRMLIHQMLRLLGRFSTSDKGSKELLHFGCMVYARKNS